MVSCPKCGAEFPPKDMWTEVFQAVESETGKGLNKYVIFSFPECHVHIFTIFQRDLMTNANTFTHHLSV
jgi:hypothetical protein